MIAGGMIMDEVLQIKRIKMLDDVTRKVNRLNYYIATAEERNIPLILLSENLNGMLNSIKNLVKLIKVLEPTEREEYFTWNI
jgi:hypothetical protein